MEQPYLKKWGFVIFITTLSTIPPLATDMYMPALPQMVDVFNTTTTLTSFTMTIFFVFMALGILIFGPLSDKYGRKPILLLSISITLIASILCSLSPTIEFLIAVRAIQALGAGGMMTTATALIRDSFSGKEMGQVLSITQALGFLAPMLAPIIGAVILMYFDWSKTFLALAAMNIISLIGALLLKETLPKEKRSQNGVARSIFGIVTVLKNKTFTGFFLVGSILTAPFMAYIAVASYVYINGFGVSETQFSIYFAITSAVAVVGPLLYMRIGHKSVRLNFIVIFVMIAVSGVLLLTIGQLTPILFLISFVVFAMAATYFRPMISTLILQSQSTNIGAASAMMNFGFTMVGSIAMFIGSQAWSSYVTGIAMTIFMFYAVALLIFIIALKRKVIQL